MKPANRTAVVARLKSLIPTGLSRCAGRFGKADARQCGQSVHYRLPSGQKPNGMAVIMCLRGGGYGRLAMNHVGHDMAAWFTTQGITYAVLKYRMPNWHNEVPPVGRRTSHPPRTRAGQKNGGSIPNRIAVSWEHPQAGIWRLSLPHCTAVTPLVRLSDSVLSVIPG